jgi:poly(3-hydroxybutyrate) depolymerase
MPKLTIGGLTGTFTMRFPEERPAPLLLVLHGNHPEATGQQMREWTAFDKQTDFAIALCVPKTSSTLCGQAVFVDQVTGAGLPPDAVPGEIDRFG